MEVTDRRRNGGTDLEGGALAPNIRITTLLGDM